MLLIRSIYSQDGEQDGNQPESDAEEHALSPILEEDSINALTQLHVYTERQAQRRLNAPKSGRGSELNQ